jgi:flagellar motor protein MotB
MAITGYADATGSRDANVALAKARAIAVRDALVAAGVTPDRLQLREPRDVIGSGSNDEARRVDLTTLNP